MTKQNKLMPWKLVTIFVLLMCCIGLGITLFMPKANDRLTNSRASEKTINDNNGRNGVDGISHFFENGSNGEDGENVD